MIKRLLEKTIQEKLFKGKAIVIIGPRQTGKTTLARKIIDSLKEEYLWLNGDHLETRESLKDASKNKLDAILGKNRIIVIDEAQRIQNIGLTLKIIVDSFPEKQLIITGSSSLDLNSEINEPLTGRKWEYKLYPISYNEQVENTDYLSEKSMLKHRMVYGYYPEIINSPGDERELLELLVSSYLYKDLFVLDRIKKPSLLDKILKALAYQVGSEVSYNEIGQLVGANSETVEKYIGLLEETFVVFKLQALSRNLRNEIKKSRKIYFYDNGVRNTILGNFNSIETRTDAGALWENFIIVERMKFLHYQKIYCNKYFWRTHAQQEIDYIEEKDGKLYGFEFKWNPNKKVSFPKTFLNAYPENETKVISPSNFHNMLGYDF